MLFKSLCLKLFKIFCLNETLNIYTKKSQIEKSLILLLQIIPENVGTDYKNEQSMVEGSNT